MPYIKPKYRSDIDKLLEPLLEHLSTLPLEKQDGVFNYTVTSIMKSLYSEDNYFTYNRSMGSLSALQEEWYRRKIAPYEDRKAKENGDVY
jgi:hypothetical protein